MLVSSSNPDDVAVRSAPAHGTAAFDAVTAALSEAQDLTDLLNRVLDAVMHVSGVDGGSIFLFDEHTRDLRLLVHRGVSQAFADAFAADPGPTLRAIAATPTGAVVSADLAEQQARRPELAA